MFEIDNIKSIVTLVINTLKLYCIIVVKILSKFIFFYSENMSDDDSDDNIDNNPCN